MKKVLIIAYNDLNNSGVPNVIYQTIKALHKEYSFDVLVFGNDDYYRQKLRNEGIEINLIRYIEKKPKSKLARVFWWFYKRPRGHYLFTKKLLKENAYLVVHSFKEYDCWSFFKAAKKAGINKRIFHCSVNLAIDKKAKDKFLKYRNRRLSLRYANVFVGVSELSCKNAFRNKKYTVLNQLFSLQVLKELKKLHENTRLNLVGASGITPYCQKLIDYVKTNDLEKDVSFIDKSDSVERIYEKTTFVIIPSLREGFSLVAIEAQACGIELFASSNVPKEIDCGGAMFIELSKGPVFWAKEIYDKYLHEGNVRALLETNIFSFNRFKADLVTLYKL